MKLVRQYIRDVLLELKVDKDVIDLFKRGVGHVYDTPEELAARGIGLSGRRTRRSRYDDEGGERQYKSPEERQRAYYSNIGRELSMRWLYSKMIESGVGVDASTKTLLSSFTDLEVTAGKPWKDGVHTLKATDELEQLYGLDLIERVRSHGATKWAKSLSKENRDPKMALNYFKRSLEQLFGEPVREAIEENEAV